jgi:hypothetical protein
MEKNKWLHIYSNILRMSYIAYLESYKRNKLQEIDTDFSYFLKNNLETSQDLSQVKFFGGDFLMSFAYQILVRTFEFIEKQKEIESNQFYSELEEYFKLEEFLNEGSVKVEIPAKKDLSENGVKNFIKKLRNGVSHSRFEHPDYYSIRLYNVKSDGKINFQIVFQYDAFLNFCKDFGFMVNKNLIKKNFVDTI